MKLTVILVLGEDFRTVQNIIENKLAKLNIRERIEILDRNFSNRLGYFEES